MGDVRRRVVPGRRVARRGVSRRPGGLLHPAQFRHHRSQPVRRRTRPRHRGHLHPAETTFAIAATSPACCSSRSGSTGRSTREGCGAPSGSTTPGRCASIDCVCSVATPTPAAPTCASPARLDSDAQRPIGIRTLIDGVPHAETTHVVASGDNDLEWSLDLADPALWWPRSLGDQPLTMVTVEVLVDGELSDRRQRRTGLRQVTWDDWVCSVNGERIFLKGANLLPTSSDLAHVEAAADPGRHRIGDRSRPRRPACARARRPSPHLRRRRRTGPPAPAGLPAAVEVRPIGPLPGGRSGAGPRRLARAPSVDRLVVGARRSHAHVGPSRHGTPRRPAACAARCAAAAAQQLPSWNKSILDRWVKRSFERSDPTRATVRPFRRRPAPAAARRHRQPSLVRMAPRRGERTRRLRQAPAAHGAVREPVRRRFGADHRPVLRRRTRRQRRGPTSTGSGSRRRTRTTSTRSSGCSHPTGSPRSRSGSGRRSSTNRTS